MTAAMTTVVTMMAVMTIPPMMMEALTVLPTMTIQMKAMTPTKKAETGIINL